MSTRPGVNLIQYLEYYSLFVSQSITVMIPIFPNTLKWPSLLEGVCLAIPELQQTHNHLTNMSADYHGQTLQLILAAPCQ